MDEAPYSFVAGREGVTATAEADPHSTSLRAGSAG
jgi:hypothetical protein